MTREEAKREIDFLDYYLQNHTDDYGEESHTAMMMAIQALEQEPCEDTISRQNDILPNIDKEVESYKKLLKHPVIKSIMGMDETQEQLDFVQPHKRIPVTLTVSGDLISREAVEEIINDIRDCISVEGYWAILERLKKLPSVKPQEPKTGHWIDTGSGQECSECHEIQYGYDNHRFYCGNCGARMEVEQNG